MHHGIEILLARMESHPEDFIQGAGGSWLHQVEKNKKYFNQEETDKVKEKLRQINLDRMTQNLMEAMVKDEEPINHYTDSLAQTMARTKNQSIQAVLSAGLDTAFKDAYANYQPVTPEELEEDMGKGEYMTYKWSGRGYDVEVNKDWKEE